MCLILSKSVGTTVLDAIKAAVGDQTDHLWKISFGGTLATTHKGWGGVRWPKVIIIEKYIQILKN